MGLDLNTNKPPITVAPRGAYYNSTPGDIYTFRSKLYSETSNENYVLDSERIEKEKEKFRTVGDPFAYVQDEGKKNGWSYFLEGLPGSEEASTGGMYDRQLARAEAQSAAIHGKSMLPSGSYA